MFKNKYDRILNYSETTIVFLIIVTMFTILLLKELN